MKADRLVSIIMILLEKKRVGAQELADLFEVSPRTIYRDMDAISMAGIPVRSISGVGGGFEIMPGYKVDQKVFSADDLSALLMGLSNLSGMIRCDELVNALAKVRSIIPAEQSGTIELKASQVRIDLTPWMGSGHIQSCLETVKTALQEHKLLSFAYMDGHGSRTERTVEPCQLVLKSNHWYVQGYCRLRNDYRLFRLSRMSDLEMKQETFVPRDYPEPVLDFGEILETMQTEIKLRIHQSVLDRVLELCTYDRVTPDGDDHYIVRFPFVERDYYYDMLLSFGDQCECLEPRHVREEMKRRIQRLSALYEDQNRVIG